MESLIGFKANTLVYVDENEFIYILKRKVNKIMYMACIRTECGVRAVIRPGGQVICRKQHLHHSETERLAELRFRESIRAAVRDYPIKSAKDIFNEVQIHHPIAALTVSFGNVRSLVYKTRAEMVPPVPQNMSQFSESITNPRYN